jgi:hypothetical protein
MLLPTKERLMTTAYTGAGFGANLTFIVSNLELSK